MRSFFLLATVLGACAKEASPREVAPSNPPAVSTPAPIASSSSASAVASAIATVGPMRKLTPADLPKDVTLGGKIEKVIGWSDKNGDNFVVFTVGHQKAPGDDPSASTYLRVEHIVSSGGQRKTLRSVHDKEEKCSDDLTAEFRDGALAVTDLDNDGIGEVTFGYILNCTTDVSPATLKILMLENGEKYALRGQMLVVVSPSERYGGGYQVDPSFQKAPPAFLEHAKATWTKVGTAR
jgi:hypothetical protein